MKKLLTAAIVAVLTLLTIKVYGADMILFYDGEYHQYIADDIRLSINGKEIVTKEMPPIAINGRTLVPVREVFESIGGKVTWLEQTNQVRISYDGREILFTLDSRTLYSGKAKRTIPADEPAPMVINEKTMVPIRVVADLLDFEVEWNDRTRTVNLYDENYDKKSGGNNNSAKGGMISDVSLESDSDGEYVYLTYGTPVKPQISRYSSPERVVIDFGGAQLKQGTVTLASDDGDIITSVRGANHEDKARIVLDVNDQPNIGVYKTSDGLVIAVSPGGRSYTTKIDIGKDFDQADMSAATPDDNKTNNDKEVNLDTTGTVDTANTRNFDYTSIVIDPGHGGKDPGTVWEGVNEKDVALAISKLVRDKLEDEGYNVVMTRETDIYPSLQDRVDIANKPTDGTKIPALYVSIHCNSFEYDLDVNGTQVYYHTDSKYGTILAENIYNSNVANTSLKPARVHDGSNLYVIRKSLQPAALVETGFLSNEGDRDYLNSKRGQEDLATGIVEGIIKTMEQMKKDKGK